MRINQALQDSNIKVTKLRIEIELAIANHLNTNIMTYHEVIESLLETVTHINRNARKMELEDEDDNAV